jgi:hypothetical protein
VSGSLTVNFSRSGTTGFFGGGVVQFRNSSGVGVSAYCRSGGRLNGDPSPAALCASNPTVPLAGVSANSAIVKFNVDWSAQNGASRSSLTTGVGAFTETAYNFNSQYTIYGGYHANAGVAGTKTIGYSVPTGEVYTLLGVEVKGT